MTIVHVRHPVPYRMIPERSRNERLTFVAQTTPVDLREAGRSEIAEAFAYKGRGHQVDTPVFEHRGGYWQRLGTGRARQGKPVLDAAAFISYLASGHDETGAADIGDALWLSLSRTPLVARHDGGGRTWHKGDDVDVAKARRISHDGLERARADLLRFFEDGIVVSGDAVYMRMRGPLVFGGLQWASFDTPHDLVMYWEESWERTYHTAGAVPARLDRLGDLWNVLLAAGTVLPLRRGGMTAPVEQHQRLAEPVASLIAGMDHARLGDVDVMTMANEAPRRCLHAFAKVQWDGDAPDRVLALARELSRWEGIAALGGVRRDEAEETLTLSRDFIQAGIEAGWEIPPALSLLRAYIDRFALPLVAGAPVLAAEDADALDGLSPGAL